jgi:cytoskeletal protein RodZ
MPLTGELSDLSLAELIEFFCNQRKSGRLKVIYSIGPGYFYLQAGAVVHARIGALRGIEAVYYALTLPNASFAFNTAFEPPEQTINQPWTSIVLEGLRRMDEGIRPGNPFPEGEQLRREEAEPALDALAAPVNEWESVLSEKLTYPEISPMPEFLSEPENGSRWTSRQWTPGAVVGAVVLIVAVIGAPWGWYAHNKAAKAATEARSLPVENSQPSASAVETNQLSADSAPSQTVEPVAAPDAELAARRQRDARAKENVKAQGGLSATNPTQPSAKASQPAGNPNGAKNQSPSAAGAKKVIVQVTYDENGRVTQASGGDPTALRIARQKRFPAGKAGSATITIPIN